MKNLKKLIPMSDWVLRNCKKKNFTEEAIAYANLLNKPLELSMFQGEEPLFPNFIIQENHYKYYNGIRIYCTFGDFSYVFREKEKPPKVSELTKHKVMYNLKAKF